MARSKRSVEKEEFWRLVLNEHAASGLSIKAFCKREAVSEASFYFWRRELAIRNEQSVQTPDSPAIIPVRVVDSEACHPQADLTDGDQRPASSGVVEVIVPGGFTLRADAATDAQHVTAWLLGSVRKVLYL